ALYEKTESNASNMTNELVLGVVEDLGFDSDKVTDCISEGKAKDEMQKDIDDLNTLSQSLLTDYPCSTNSTEGLTCISGVGTPFFLVGKLDGDMVKGYIIGGAYPYESFVEIIEAL
ncbi:MAG: hypothetical protein ABIC57_04130, partial [bacterium]